MRRVGSDEAERTGVQASAMLWADAQYVRKETLPLAIGDSYLYALNPIHRGLRDLALASGTTFTCNPCYLVHAYSIAPLFTLDEIVSTGTIPYLADAEVLRMISGEANLVFDLRLATAALPGKRILHETAHIIADRHLALLRTNSRKGQAEYVVRSLIAEGFANTMEGLAAVYATQDLHQLFYSINSYFCGFDIDRLALCRVALGTLGIERLVALGICVYFFLNCRPDVDHPSAGFLSSTSQALFGSLDRTQCALLELVGTKLFALSKQFRKITTPAYFRFVGREDDYRWVQRLDLESPTAVASLELASAALGLASLTSKWHQSDECSATLHDRWDEGALRYPVRMSQEVRWCKKGEDVMVLHCSNGQLYSLDHAAASAWCGICEGLTIEEIVARVGSSAETEHGTTRQDIVEFIRDLYHRDLVY